MSRRSHRTVINVAAAVLAAATCVSAPGRATSHPAAFGYDDLFRVVGVSAPQLSPDGTHIAIIVTRTDRERDRRNRSLAIVDVADGSQKVIATGSVGSPRWSPSGDRLAFVANAQVWACALDGGRRVRLTHASTDVRGFAWRPDGKAIVYIAADEQPAKTGDDRYIDAYHVANDPALASGAAIPAHLWLQPLDGGAPRRLGSRDGSVSDGSSLSFSPDGATLAYLHAATSTLNDADSATIRLVDVASGRERTVDSPSGSIGDPVFSPDGAHLAFVHSADDGQVDPVAAYVINRSGGPGRALAPRLDRAVRDLAWRPGTEEVDLTVIDGTHTVLYRVPAGAAAERVDLGALSITSDLEGAIARSGAIAFIGQTTQHPAELYYAAPGAAPRQLTHLNDHIAALALGSSERITYRSTSGVDGDAVLLRPPGFDAHRRYPLVIVIHGGPAAASTETFDPLGQLMAARDWLVLEPNYRGSNNLGARYQSAIRGDKLAGPSSDIRAALETVRARGIVDDHRIAVSGWSYGAGLTLAMIERYHDWRAAMAGAPVSDIVADWATADDIDADRALLLHRSPFTPGGRAEYAAQSPISYVQDVRTPLLLMSDRGDDRVSPVGAYEFYHALRDLGRPVDFVVYPVDGHFPSDPVRAADVERRWVTFIAEHFSA